MRIVVVHNHYRSAVPSGENIVVARESAALRSAGHEVHSFDSFSDEIASWPPLRKASLPARVVWNPRSRRDLESSLRQWRPDVVHVHNTFPLLSASVLLACADARIPVVATLHNYRLTCANGSFYRDGKVCHDCATNMGMSAIRHGCYRESSMQTLPVVLGSVVQRHAWKTIPSAYVFVSSAQREALTGYGLPADRTFVKWNLLELMSRPQADESSRVVYIGRLDQVKGIPTLMRSWDRFRAGPLGGRLRLAIAGSGPLEAEVRTWASGHADVEVLGMLQPEQCRELLAGSLAAIVPSEWEETFGLVAVEAMSAGVPVIASAIGALPELIEDSGGGVLFTPGDVAGLAGVLQDVAAEPARWRALGTAARASYERRFDPAANIEELLDIYRFAIADPTHSPRHHTSKAS
jgi:glycosyltransferase involved in cell wall biosynthesis